MSRSAFTTHALRLSQLGMIATLLLIPVWLRLPGAPNSFSPLYALGFALFWPMLWSCLWWALAGFPGARALRQDRRRLLWAAALLALCAWAWLSWSWAYMRQTQPQVAVAAALPFTISALFAIAWACAGPSSRTLALALVLGLAWNSLLAGAQVAAQGSVGLGQAGEFGLDPARSGVAVVEADGVRWLRPYGLLPHPNILAGFLAAALAVGSAIALTVSRRWWLITIMLLAGLYALLLTFSRAAWLGLAAAGAILLVGLWPLLRTMPSARRRAAALTVLAGVLAGVFLLLYGPFILARTTGAVSESIEQRSVADRLVFTEIALDAIAESPFLGIGIGNFPWYAAQWLARTPFDLRGQPVHNIYLSLQAELGLVGLALWVAALLAGGTAAFTRWFQAPPAEKAFRAALLAGVVVFLAVGLFDHYPYTLMHTQALWLTLLAAAGRPSAASSAS